MIKKLIIVFLLGSWATSFAQEPIRFTTKQGLPTNHIYDIAEDENGFMWFATKQGLVKYDGDNFKTFTIQDGLPNNDTWLLELDYKGRLWFFSKSAYQGYIKNDSIYTFATKDKEVLSPRFIYKTNQNFSFFGNLGIQTFNEDEIVTNKLFNTDNQLTFYKKIYNIQKDKGFTLPNGMPILYNPEVNEMVFLQKEKLLIYDTNFAVPHFLKKKFQ